MQGLSTGPNAAFRSGSLGNISWATQFTPLWQQSRFTTRRACTMGREQPGDHGCYRIIIGVVEDRDEIGCQVDR